jgi:hypothetical protein
MEILLGIIAVPLGLFLVWCMLNGDNRKGGGW